MHLRLRGKGSHLFICLLLTMSSPGAHLLHSLCVLLTYVELLLPAPPPPHHSWWRIPTGLLHWQGSQAKAVQPAPGWTGWWKSSIDRRNSAPPPSFCSLPSSYLGRKHQGVRLVGVNSPPHTGNAFLAGQQGASWEAAACYPCLGSMQKPRQGSFTMSQFAGAGRSCFKYVNSTQRSAEVLMGDTFNNK